MSFRRSIVRMASGVQRNDINPNLKKVFFNCISLKASMVFVVFSVYNIMTVTITLSSISFLFVVLFSFSPETNILFSYIELFSWITFWYKKNADLVLSYILYIEYTSMSWFE